MNDVEVKEKVLKKIKDRQKLELDLAESIVDVLYLGGKSKSELSNLFLKYNCFWDVFNYLVELRYIVPKQKDVKIIYELNKEVFNG